MDEFCQYLDEWEQSIKKCTDFSKVKMGLMVLSAETRLGHKSRAGATIFLGGQVELLLAIYQA